MYSLETERLILRPFTNADLDFLNHLHSDLDVLRYTHGRTRSHHENSIYLNTMQELHEQNLGHLAVIRKSDNYPIGRCGFSYFYGVHENGIDHFYWGSPNNVTKNGDVFKTLELGYTYVKSVWGNGYATEAAIALRDHAYSQLGYNGFSSLIVKENIASIAVAQKLGASISLDCMMHNIASFDLRNEKNE